ncbi:hypothetical protein G6F68_021318 [Rhizopus microsporus]|nr:hypothetical protein G6F68_021318 [Rhizopus microsporus]
MAAASTGTRKRALRDFSQLSKAMIAAPTTAPMPMKGQGSSPPNRPLAPAAIRLACGAARAFGCSSDFTPMP